MRKSKSQKSAKNTKKQWKFNPKKPEFPDCSMVDMILESERKWAHNIAYTYYGYDVNYRDFVKQIRLVAKALKHCGVEENDVVTICMPNTPESILMVYAVNMVGGICNMVHPLSGITEIEDAINGADSKYLLILDSVFEKNRTIKRHTSLKKIIVATPFERADSLMRGLYRIANIKAEIKFPHLDNTVVHWDTFLLGAWKYRGEYAVRRGINDPAVILYTGGTTGDSMGAVLTNGNFNALGIQAISEIKQAVPGAKALSVLPIFHGFGLGVCVHTPLCTGMGCILIPKFNYKKFASLIKRYRPNFLIGVPTLFESLINCKLGKKDLRSVTAIISGGDTLDPTMRKNINSFLRKHGSRAKIRVGYGLTESTSACCLVPENYFKDDIIGKPLPGNEFKIVRPGTHEAVKTGVTGEICISGPTVMTEYLGHPAETMKTLQQHEDGKVWVHTGDAGHIGKDGMIYFGQRLKRIIVSSGYNVYPSHIEKVINSHKKVLATTVIGVPHPRKGQVAKAFIVLKDGYEPDEKLRQEIKKLCEKNIAKYALPAEYKFIDKLPTTKVGKVAYRELK